MGEHFKQFTMKKSTKNHSGFIKNIGQLDRDGFVSVTYPRDLRDAVEQAVKAWKEFCVLAQDTKTNLAYSNGSDGVGYELKLGVGNKADRKENFDVALSGLSWLSSRCNDLGAPAQNFVRKAAALVALMKPIVLDFAGSVEEQYGVTGLHDEVEEGEGVFFVRFIHYFGDRHEGEETATAHIDQSGFTLHLYESDPGLQALTHGKQWVDMPVSEGETVIIPSMQLQLRSRGRLDATCHRVIANEKTATNGRYSAVCFVQLPNTPKYNKAVGGRLQEKEPGFNYGMDPAEFARLFA
jgi:isopenicillin N synthase-like dioxygenase